MASSSSSSSSSTSSSTSSSSTSSSSQAQKRLILVASDGASFSVRAAALSKFGAIKGMVEDGCYGEDRRIPVPAVGGKALARIIRWSERHTDAAATEEELREWDARFARKLDQGALYDLLTGADFLGAPELVDLIASRIADMMRGRSTEEIREMFGIVKDFTPEQEEKIRQDTAWAFED